MTTTRIRAFLALETLIFAIAALIHFELLVAGYGDRGTGTAESVIGGVLLLGLVFTYARPASTRTIGIAVQTFALLGTLVGLTLLITLGGPTLDYVIHVVMLIVLVVGLMVTVRSRRVVGV